MSFQTPITIAEAIRNIDTNQYLLPAIQREFTWESEKVEWLFDSIMRNYPISSFLFWRVEGETKKEYKFYQFLKDYRERYKTHNEEFNTSAHNDFTAVLDGQQRLTSLYIGLKGSYAYRTPKLKEENSERVYPTRYLYLNIENSLENEEDGRIYEFTFLTLKEVEGKKSKWFRVSEILSMNDDFEFNTYLDKHDLKKNEFTYRSLSLLKNVIHSKPIINFFLEKEQNIEKALNIFIRINSGGEPLNFSDLIMSIAVANWEKKDARREIHSLVDAVSDKGFKVSKDFILKTFLYLYSKDIKFKVTNFKKENAKEFEKEWDKIRDTILSVFDLVKTFGFTDPTLTSKNALLPVIYYLYHSGITKDFHTRVEFRDDREVIKRWLHTVLIKRIFGGHSDTILAQIRKAFTSDVGKAAIETKSDTFPLVAVNANMNRESGISMEFVESILLTQKDDRYAFSILSLLYPQLDYKNNAFDMDHLHPADSFKKLQSVNKKASWEIYNSILNLQMLDANENRSKNKQSLDLWVKDQTKVIDKHVFLQRQLIPDCSFELMDFETFISERKTILMNKLKGLLVS